jgi:hypothetical protein
LVLVVAVKKYPGLWMKNLGSRAIHSLSTAYPQVAPSLSTGCGLLGSKDFHSLFDTWGQLVSAPFCGLIGLDPRV